MINEKPEIILYVRFKSPDTLGWREYDLIEQAKLIQTREYTDAELSYLFKDKKTQQDVHWAIIEFLDQTYGLNLNDAYINRAFMSKFKAKRYF